MIRIVIILIFSLILGNVNSQELIYFSVDTYAKMSFNSTNAFTWDSKTTQVSDLFTYEHSSYCLSQPLRFGFSFGVQLKPKHVVEIGIHQDGVSSKERLRLASYQSYVNYVTPGFILDKSKTTQSRIFINYKYSLINKKQKTTLSVVPSFSISRRAGPKGDESVGGFGTSGYLESENLTYTTTNVGHTAYSNYGYQLGLGLSSDIFINKNYWFSILLQYSHSKTALYYNQTRIHVTDVNTGMTTNYMFNLFNRTSGLYFGVSRKFQLIPWIKKRKGEERI